MPDVFVGRTLAAVLDDRTTGINVRLRDSSYNGSSDSGATDDWGVTFRGLNSLLLEDSIISGAPLCDVGPLIQCLTCSSVTLRNVTLRHIATGVQGGNSWTAPLGQPAAAGLKLYGAVHLGGLKSAVLEGCSCTDVYGAYGWSCLLLEYFNSPSNSLRMSDSSFHNNTVVGAVGPGVLAASMHGLDLQSQGLAVVTASKGYGAVVVAGGRVGEVLVERCSLTGNRGGDGGAVALLATVVSLAWWPRP